MEGKESFLEVGKMERIWLVVRLSLIVRKLVGRCVSYRIESKGWKYIASGPAIDNDAEVECWLLGEDGKTEKKPDINKVDWFVVSPKGSRY